MFEYLGFGCPLSLRNYGLAVSGARTHKQSGLGEKSESHFPAAGRWAAFVWETCVFACEKSSCSE